MVFIYICLFKCHNYVIIDNQDHSPAIIGSRNKFVAEVSLIHGVYVVYETSPPSSLIVFKYHLRHLIYGKAAYGSLKGHAYAVYMLSGYWNPVLAGFNPFILLITACNKYSLHYCEFSDDHTIAVLIAVGINHMCSLVFTDSPPDGSWDLF